MPLKVFAPCDLSFCNQVGRGSLGPVFRCRLAAKLSFDEVTVKLYHGDASVADVQSQLAPLAKAKHESLSRIYGLVCLNEGVGLVLEPMQGASLAEVLNSLHSPAMTLRLNWVTTITSALQHLHQRGIVHCDLKPENILFRDDFHKDPVITDYGLAKFYDRYVPQWTWNRRYAAPEATSVLTCTTQSDIFSLGLVIWQIITLKRLPEGSLPTLACVVDVEHRRMIANCLSYDPLDRPQLEDIIEAFSI